MGAAPTRALVLQPPIYLDERFIDYPPLMPYASAVMVAELRRLCLDVEVLDAGCLAGAEFVRVPTGWRWGVTPERYGAELTALLGHTQPAAPPAIAVVAQSVFQYTAPNHPVLAATIRAVREVSGATTIVVADQSPGGMHRLDIPLEVRQGWLPAFDYLASFESDGAMAEIVAAVAAGTGRRAPGEPPREVRGYVADLRATRDPAFDALDLAAYQDGLRSSLANRDWLYTMPAATVPILTSRGCPFRCNFCFPEAAWRQGARVGGFRAYPLERVEAQLADLAARGVRHLVVMDATINGDPERFEGVLALFARYGMTFDLPNGMRADLLDDANVERLVGRLSELSISAESGDPEVVARVVGKRLDLGHIERVAARCHAVGQPLSIHWMVGQPGETITTVNRTLDLAWDLFARFGAKPLVQFATPFPGTRLYREAIANGWLPDDPEGIPSLPSHTGRLAVLRPPDMDVEAIERMYARFSARLEAARAPRVEIAVTARCPNRCVMCRTSANDAGGDPDDSRGAGPDAVRAAIEAAAANRAGEVVLGGGEPTVDRELVRHVRHAREVGVARVVVETNGRMLAHRPNAERLVRAAPSEVAVSIQGASAGVHDAVTREPGSFAQSIEGLRHVMELVAARRAPVAVRVQTVVTAANLRDLPALAAQLRRHRVPAWTLRRQEPVGRGAGLAAPSLEAGANAIRSVIEGLAGGGPEVCVEGVPACLLGAHGALARAATGATAEARARIPACASCEFRPGCAGMPASALDQALALASGASAAAGVPAPG
jgi:MoaA/NifB/PqqE/SkfB family radical SAM enzyme